MNALVVLEKLGIRFPGRVLFEDVNWTIYEGMRVALAGRNGSGKSTLLNIIAGLGESTEGRRTVVGSRKPRIGYLNQSLLEAAVSEVMEKKDKSPSALDYLTNRILVAREHDDIYEDEAVWETKKTLHGLGFSDELMTQPMNRLSGGWLLRVFLAAALAERPDVLLLDEPTNHLDLSSIQWLEEFLIEEFKGSLILITHDVALQKRTTDSLAVLHGGRFFFRKHQNDYLTFRDSLEDEKRLLNVAIGALQKKIDENREFYTRFRAQPNLASRAQSKLKMAETQEEEKAALEDRLRRVEGFHYNLHLRFRLSGPGSKFPISTKQLTFQYKDDQPFILKDVNLDIKRGQKVAIMGDNGAGKTTLLNVIAERLKPTSGEVLRGYATEDGYFGQHQLEELDLDASVLDNLRGRPGVGLEQARAWLGAFGFVTDNDIQKKTKVLSGGEKARLALLRIVTSPINLCLLDEPTNHLDVETKELLRKAIVEFEGTVLIVSHDRDFVAGIADRIIYLTTDHKLTDHLGNMESFFAKYPEHVRHIEGHATPSAAPSMSLKENAKPATASASLSYEERKKVKNLIRSLSKKVEAAEKEIEDCGNEKTRLSESPTPNLTRALADLDAKLHAAMAAWEKMSSELDALRTKYPDIQ